VVYGVALAAVVIQNLWEFKPDKRFEKIRSVGLQELFDGFFEDANSKVEAGQRLPFRRT
jgi:hypothetical protein